jgi:arylsulfatase A-like enzyme
VRPNVLLIIFDTARADAFEPYGAPQGASQAVGDLARRGKAMPNLYGPACWTLPSHASLFTGLLPRATGLITAPGGQMRACRAPMEAQRDRLLPEVLRRAGYEAAAVSTNVWISELTGFATGFDRFVTVDSGRQGKLHDQSRRARLAWDLEGVRARVDDGAEEAGRILRTWIKQPRDRPAFWFVNLIECHSPYLPPSRHNELGLIDRWRAAEEARRYLTLGSIWRACVGGFDVPDEALERMRRLYAGAIEALDDWLAAVLETLDREGALDETLVIVTSDHGENFGVGGLMGHSYSLDDRLIRLPCVTAGPGAFAPREVHSLAALPRLIAEAVGLEQHPWENGLPPPGVAVAQFGPPSGPEDPRVLKAVDDWGLGPEAVSRMTTPMSCATDGRYKLMRRGDREELYDLEDDPLELSPVNPATPSESTVTHLRDALAHPGTTAAAPVQATELAEISDEERQRLEDQMRLLGYL